MYKRLQAVPDRHAKSNYELAMTVSAIATSEENAAGGRHLPDADGLQPGVYLLERCHL